MECIQLQVKKKKERKKVEYSMLTLSDCIGGAVLGYIVYWVQWTFKSHLDSLFTSDSYWSNTPLCLLYSIFNLLFFNSIHGYSYMSNACLSAVNDMNKYIFTFCLSYLIVLIQWKDVHALKTGNRYNSADVCV